MAVSALYHLNEVAGGMLLAGAADGAVRVWRNFPHRGGQRLAAAWRVCPAPHTTTTAAPPQPASVCQHLEPLSVLDDQSCSCLRLQRTRLNRAAAVVTTLLTAAVCAAVHWSDCLTDLYVSCDPGSSGPSVGRGLQRFSGVRVVPETRLAGGGRRRIPQCRPPVESGGRKERVQGALYRHPQAPSSHAYGSFLASLI